MAPKNSLKIPIFDDEFLFNVYEEPVVDTDIPSSEWISPEWVSNSNLDSIGERSDPVAFYELSRLLKYQTCPFCRDKMIQVLEKEQPGILYICKSCLYWGGRGTRDWGSGPKDHRGILGRYKFINDPESISPAILLRYLRKSPSDLLNISPTKAEKFIVDLVRDAYECDARLVGGVHDRGVDGIIIKNDKVGTIIQIKWRESSHKAESVSVVREVAGTLLNHGVPNGMIVSTRSHYSSAAIEESNRISDREVIGVGRLNLELKSFGDIIDMLEIKCKTLNQAFDPKELIGTYIKDECIFG